MKNRINIAKNFVKSLNHPEIKKAILFGSVARGEDNEESDIDILLITSKDKDKLIIKDDIYTKVFNILIDTNQRISIKFKTQNHFNKHANSLFFRNIKKDGILLN